MAKSAERQFKNVKTGLTEIVVDEKTIDLMERSDRYEEVEAKKSTDKKAEDKTGEK